MYPNQHVAGGLVVTGTLQLTALTPCLIVAYNLRSARQQGESASKLIK